MGKLTKTGGQVPLTYPYLIYIDRLPIAAGYGFGLGAAPLGLGSEDLVVNVPLAMEWRKCWVSVVV